MFHKKLKTKISTEEELVGVVSFIPMVLCARYFLAVKWFKVDGYDVFQDNQSSILIEKNGRTSRSGITRNIRIRFLWLTKWSLAK